VLTEGPPSSSDNVPLFDRPPERKGCVSGAIYSFGYATDYVWLRTYSYYGRTYLRVWVHTDFAASNGRIDYNTDASFLR